MSISIPTLDYGTVVGRYLIELADSSDADLKPDVYPASGHVVFTPGTNFATVHDATPDPAIIFPQKVIGVLDAQGYLCTASFDAVNNRYARTVTDEYIPTRRGVSLQSTDDTSLNPHSWTWRVEFHFNYRGSSIKFDGFNFSLPTDTSVDLTTAVPVETSKGEYTIVGPRGPVGEKGDTGPPNNIGIGTVTTRATGQSATASITGVYPDQVLNLGLPQGPVGPSGGPIPAGGTANQQLRKTDSGGYEWFTPSYNSPIPLGADVDLNTLMTPDDYHQGSSAQALPGLNYPVPFAGYLEVRARTTYIYQYYTVYGDPFASVSAGAQYVRAKNGSSEWTSWKKVQFAEDLPTISTSATASHVVQRLTNGHVTVPTTPTASSNATSKGYVDGQITNTLTSATNLVNGRGSSTGTLTATNDANTLTTPGVYNLRVGTKNTPVITGFSSSTRIEVERLDGYIVTTPTIYQTARLNAQDSTGPSIPSGTPFTDYMRNSLTSSLVYRRESQDNGVNWSNWRALGNTPWYPIDDKLSYAVGNANYYGIAMGARAGITGHAHTPMWRISNEMLEILATPVLSAKTGDAGESLIGDVSQYLLPPSGAVQEFRVPIRTTQYFKISGGVAAMKIRDTGPNYGIYVLLVGDGDHGSTIPYPISTLTWPVTVGNV